MIKRDQATGGGKNARPQKCANAGLRERNPGKRGESGRWEVRK